MSSPIRSARQVPSVRFALDGGMLALLDPVHSVPLVSFVIALRSGSDSDPVDKAGLARIAMRMLRRGCEGMTAEQIDFRIDALGAEVAVDAGTSSVAIHAQVIARNLDGLVDLLAKMLGTPTFVDSELERLKRETVAEIEDARDSDRVVAQKALHRTLFAGHAYGRNPGGTTESVRAIGIDDVLAFYHSFVVTSNIVIGVAGDVVAERIPELASRLVAGLASGRAAVDPVAEPSMRPGRRLLVVDKPERTQTQILVATLGTSPHDDDHVPLYVANGVFGGTFTSRLMREVRSKRGWSYGASARASIDRHRQAWVLWTFPAASDAAPCLKLVIELMEAWVAHGVTAREVAFIKRYLIRSHAFEIDTAQKRLQQSLDVELLGLPPDYYTGWLGRVGAVDAEAASLAVSRRIRPENLLCVAVATASNMVEPLRSAISGLEDTQIVAFDAE
jgi:zinc protease